MILLIMKLQQKWVLRVAFCEIMNVHYEMPYLHVNAASGLSENGSHFRGRISWLVVNYLQHSVEETLICSRQPVRFYRHVFGKLNDQWLRDVRIKRPLNSSFLLRNIVMIKMRWNFLQYKYRNRWSVML